MTFSISSMDGHKRSDFLSEALVKHCRVEDNAYQSGDIALNLYFSGMNNVQLLLGSKPEGVTKDTFQQEYEKMFGYPLLLQEVRCKSINHLIQIFEGVKTKQYINGRRSTERHCIRFKKPQVQLHYSFSGSVLIIPSGELQVNSKALRTHLGSCHVVMTNPACPNLSEEFMRPNDVIQEETLPDFRFGDFFECCVTEFKGLDQLFLVHRPNMDALNHLMYSMELYYLRHPDLDHFQHVFRGMVGMVVAALYCDDDDPLGWHRAMILSLVAPTEVRLMFIDFGTIANVSLSVVKPLPKKFAALPAQAICTQLSSLKANSQR